MNLVESSQRWDHLAIKRMAGRNSYPNSHQTIGISYGLLERKEVRVNPGFKRYWLSVKGPKRVFQSNLEENGTAILHALSQQPTEIIEMFIFNVSRGVWQNDIPYQLLEQIKDGRTISTKYNSKILQFKSPNIVLIFSNQAPCRTSLSTDRWTIFYIQNGRLKLDS